MDTENLLRLLKENAVEFVIIGASAFPVHGYSRATLDIDLFIRPDRDNAQRTLRALKQFGYDVSEISVDDLLTKKLLIRQYLVETDIHPFVAGTTFEKVWMNKVQDFYGDTPVFFANLDDLIEMKEAAKRPRDLDDLQYLRELKKRRSVI
ncbi:MAG: nucleotidyltransferase [Nitrospinae bacterium]|nr:nucleotidyltransferase [Nitrospinota bacterium]